MKGLALPYQRKQGEGKSKRKKVDPGFAWVNYLFKSTESDGMIRRYSAPFSAVQDRALANI